MINTDGNILEKLTDSEYFLLSILVNYGKKSHPKNDVLLSKTRWGIQKLQSVKKDLISKGFLIVNGRIDKEKGGKGSNEYIVNTKLLAKYNGNQLHEFHTIEIQLDENRVIEIQLDENRVIENRVHENQTIFKVLKVSIIESLKELLKEEREKEKTPSLKEIEFENLKKQVELLSLENEKLKKEKSCEKKESGKHEFPKLNGKPASQLKTTPKHKDDLEDAFYSAEDSINLKPYELAVQNYAFENWTETLKEAFFIFCEGKYETTKRKFSGTQAKELIKAVESDTKAQGTERVEKCLRLCALNDWTYKISYQINQESRDKEDELKRQKQQANDPTISLIENSARARFGKNIREVERQDGYGKGSIDQSDQEF